MSADPPYARLSPDVVLDAIERIGYECDGGILALASYENRVYQIGTTNGFIVAKFYRPDRWPDEAILEEHEFSLELAELDIPIVAPIVVNGHSLHEHEAYRFAVFERRGGYWPELGTAQERVWMGRFVARIHAVGALQDFAHRPTLSIEQFGFLSVEDLMNSDWIPDHLVASYERISADVLAAVERNFAEIGEYRQLRIHGDCHKGNVLWTDQGPHFVDMDDCMNGPAVQDLWLFLAGSRDEMAVQLGDLLEGYGQFYDFDYRELRLIEALRALRMIRYTAWIARRCEDPAFPRAFPWFAETKYWEEHVLALMEQRAALDEPNLTVP